jgi:serine/threonine protein kinase
LYDYQPSNKSSGLAASLPSIAVRSITKSLHCCCITSGLTARHACRLTAAASLLLLLLLQRWITFQLLQGLSQAHAHGVCHGDIKCENVMVTSWNWLFLTDFASYKPTYLPADNPVSGWDVLDTAAGLLMGLGFQTAAVCRLAALSHAFVQSVLV